jgi:putative nucleotidyltransferase with HDIG domain
MSHAGSSADASRPPRILFVDDEPLVIRSLRRTLGARSLAWELRFADSGEEALRVAAAEPIDVVVSDMHMPGMDGASLLAKIQERHPDVVRIVLSGHTDRKLVFRAVPVAHQFLTKPFETPLLIATIEQAIAFRRLVAKPALRAVVGGDSSLPAAPSTYTALTQLLARADASLSDIVAVVERDVALAARVAQLSSSAFFRVPSNVRGLSGYLSYLGVDIIKTLVLSVEIVEAFGARGPTPPGFSIDSVQRHAVAAAHIARRLVATRDHAEDAFLAGLLHDVGKLVLASRVPKPFGEALARCRETGCLLHEAEREVLGVTHAEVGAYLLGIWGLPLDIVNAVLRHHDPSALGSDTVDVATAVYFGNVLAHDPEAQVDGEAPQSIDPELFVKLQGKVRLDAWRDVAREIVEGSER